MLGTWHSWWDVRIHNNANNCGVTQMKDDKTAMFLPMWIEFLVLLKQGKTAIKSSNLLWSTYSHLHKLGKQFAEIGWLTIEKVGRVNEYTFTEEGLKVAEACEKLITVAYPYMKKKKGKV